MKRYIYDIEVFSKDWLIVFMDTETKEMTVFHNNYKALKQFLKGDDVILFGFNNHHYDDWILMTILSGATVEEVKRHNDWIIKDGKDAWTFPAIQYQKKPFHSSDLKDDIPDPGISLKAIEGNLLDTIEESDVDFNIDRALTADELQEVITYCRHDVRATYNLYEERSEYLQSKQLVGEMYGVPETEALGLTNAKLSARVLDAKMTSRFDERDYMIPDSIDQNLIPQRVLEFFNQIRNPAIPDDMLFGSDGTRGLTLDVIYQTGAGQCPTTYAWGGVHGAKQAYQVEADTEHLLVCIDVSSLYPNTMINFGFCSRSMKDPKAYETIVGQRMADKSAGLKDKATAEKLVINTTYGAMLNSYNPLYDPRNGRAVCITGQLAITELIRLLSMTCKSIDFFNINTDGLAFRIERSDEHVMMDTVSAWCTMTGFKIERTDLQKVIQKDVNNYVWIKCNGDIKVKGSFVGLYKGGNFKSNSLTVLDEAVVEYFVHDVQPEETIKNEKDIFRFQNIVKSGSKYDGVFQMIDGVEIELQNVNRIYAVKDPKFGKIVKRKTVTERRHKDKATGKMVSEPVDPPKIQDTVIPDCPPHPAADNSNSLTVQALDLDYYVERAWDRITKFITPDSALLKKQSNMEVINMTVTTTTNNCSRNVYQRLAQARVDFLATPVRKNGVNKYAGFNFMELPDIVPTATKIFNKNGLLFTVSFEGEEGIGMIINIDKPEERIEFRSPMPSLQNMDGKYPNGMNAVQAVGGAETYIRRYLYYVALDIVEHDAFDATSGMPEPAYNPEPVYQPEPVQMPETVPTTVENTPERASEAEIEQIKAVLRSIRQAEKDTEQEAYISEKIAEINQGLTRAQADQMFKEVQQTLAYISEPLPFD